MSLSSFCVVTNALRLNLLRPFDPRRDRAPRRSRGRQTETAKGEDITMTKTLQIEGMMCGHCSARVQKALEALPEVAEAAVRHEDGIAVVTLAVPVADEALRAAVEAQDYRVVAIR